MAVSSDSLVLAIVEETVPGETPANPAYDLMRTTGEGLVYEVNTTNSEEMGGINRGVKDNILAGAVVTGDINFELSDHVALENLMSAVLGSDWGADPLTLPGHAGDADKTYNYQTERYFTIQKRLTLDDTPTYRYHLFTGCLPNTMSLSITPNEPITGTIGFMGNVMSTNADEIAGSTYALAGTNPIMTAPLVTAIELLSPAGISDVDGTPLGTPAPWMDGSCFTGLDLNFNNNGRSIVCIGSLGATETVFGRFESENTGTLYYNGDEPLDGLIDQEEFGLRVTMTDDNGNTYTYFFPRVVFSEATASAGGTNTDVMTEFTLKALEWQSNTGQLHAHTVQLERIEAVGATLSTPTDAANGATASTGSVSTTGGSGTLYAVVTQSATTPTHDQIVAGNDDLGAAADWSGSQAVSTTGVQTLTPAPSGLTAATAYFTHFTQHDGVAASSPVSAAGFTTDP